MSLKVLGIIVSVAGAALSVVSGIIEDKKLDKTVAEKVAEALTKKD